MKEIFYEESAFPTDSGREEKIYKILNIASIVFYAIGVIVIFSGLPRGYTYFFTENKEKESLYFFASALTIAAMFLIVGIILMLFKRRFNIVYDYLFVSGDIRISKVTGNRTKLVYELRAREISKIGKVTDPSYGKFHYQGLREIRFTKNKVPVSGKEFYYFYGNDSMGKKIIVLECREELIKNMSYYVPKDVLE